jgi:hypothetical protein
MYPMQSAQTEGRMVLKLYDDRETNAGKKEKQAEADQSEHNREVKSLRFPLLSFQNYHYDDAVRPPPRTLAQTSEMAVPPFKKFSVPVEAIPS